MTNPPLKVVLLVDCLSNLILLTVFLPSRLLAIPIPPKDITQEGLLLLLILLIIIAYALMLQCYPSLVQSTAISPAHGLDSGYILLKRWQLLKPTLMSQTVYVGYKCPQSFHPPIFCCLLLLPARYAVTAALLCTLQESPIDCTEPQGAVPEMTVQKQLNGMLFWNTLQLFEKLFSALSALDRALDIASNTLEV